MSCANRVNRLANSAYPYLLTDPPPLLSAHRVSFDGDAHTSKRQLLDINLHQIRRPLNFMGHH
jgi:hypothetical protein